MSTSAPGRYVAEHQIGRGGMATVWRATDTLLERPVALKRLKKSLLDDKEIAERFRREADTVARLSHPGLVRLLDRGDDEEGPYLVMELVEGEDLKSRIRREGALPPATAADICAQVARALAYAHGTGIVHRDIKSQNVLIDESGHAKLTDFGIARLMEGPTDTGLTRTGMLMGSSDYLSPEQADGRPLDGRTDIYSLGIVLWECLTGQLPFPGDSFVAVAMRHVTDPLPDPRRLRPEIPAHLAACALRAAAKEPERRFSTARAFAEALEDDFPSDGTAIFPTLSETSEGPTNRAPRLFGVAAALVVGGGAFALRPVLFDETAKAPNPRVSSGVLPTTAVAFDPPPRGDGSETPLELGNATDGDPATAWHTEGYNDAVPFPNLKPGVGLLLTAPASSDVSALRVSSQETPGVTFEVYEGSIDGAKLASGTLRDTSQTVTWKTPVTGPVVLWLTSVVRRGDGKYWGAIGEVQLLGVSKTPG
jgi:eukaryotic-like serine/threonine-protein kinase